MINRAGAARLARREWGLLAIIILALIYVAGAWTPSSYGEATRLLGIPRAGPVFGESRPVRSDEWAVATPYFQIAVASDFGPRDLVSPYREPLTAYFALPSRDWSMLFKPDLWGFLVLDPAHAYSLHFAFLATAMLVGFTIFLRQLGCGPGFALGVSAALFLSQFVQVWWTSHNQVLTLAAWPAVAFLWRARWWWRLPAITYTSAAWIIGELYPPFMIAGSIALMTLILAFRPDSLRPARVLTAAAAVAGGIGLALVHYAEIIAVMAQTVYPGRRVADGGGVPLLQFPAHLFPYLTSLRFEPLGIWPTNASEVGVVGTWLPLAVMVFCDQRRLLAWARANPWRVAALLGGLALTAAWIALPIPGRLAPGLNLVAPNRMLWGFGLIWMLGWAVIASRVSWRLTWRRAAVFIGLVLTAAAVSKLWLSQPPLAFARFDLFAAVLLAALMAVRRVRPAWLPPRRLILAVVVGTTLVTFGRFNPVQSAHPIFGPKTGPVIDTFKAYAAANPAGTVVVPGMWGAIVNGAGAPSVTHTLMQPQMNIFRKAYPQLSEADFNNLFNRYHHAAPSVLWAPKLEQGDLVSLPPDPFAIPLPVSVTETPPPPAVARGSFDQIKVEQISPGRWGVLASGWAGWSGVRAGQALRIALADPSVGRIVHASAYRLPRYDVVVALEDPTLFAAGFGLRAEIETGADLRAVQSPVLRVEVIDPVRGVGALAPPKS